MLNPMPELSWESQRLKNNSIIKLLTLTIKSMQIYIVR